MKDREPTDAATAPLRKVAVWTPHLRVRTRPDGTQIIAQADPLAPPARHMSDRIAHWAEAAPDRIWMAERAAGGDWHRLRYGELADLLPRIGQALLDRGLSVDRPLLILAENGIGHALMALGAQHAGVPSAAVSPAYARLAEGAKLRQIAGQITPGAVFAPDPDLAGIARGVLAGVPVLAALPEAAPGRVHQVHAALTGDSIAKFMFTSGTTGAPKAVIQTQGMLCANQAMIADCYRFLTEEPPVFVDWAPWNHVAAGSKVFNMALHFGGSYHVDAGKPTPRHMAETIRNLREIAPSWYFNVPIGYDALCDAMEGDAALRDQFFSRLRMLMYAGAGMAQRTWDRLQALSVAATGARTLMGSGLSATETGPFALAAVADVAGPGNIGLPARGVTMKLVPQAGKLELRLKGPNITPGYWREPELTAAAFDDEGFYCIGDALRPVDADDPAQGFVFDGRTAENFKLDTGTWVAVGALRAALVDALGGLAQDAVLTGENQPRIGALLVPATARIAALLGPEATLDDPRLTALLRDRLSDFATRATGSSTRVSLAMWLIDPLDPAAGEVTDKGSVNQRAVLANRQALVARLHSGGPGVVALS
ncbi:feruloyl-CoA synthase [Paracoccus gahaiensis]|uniref:Feruloyl-CoA synthase n=1 Tax=Paracoccus gahaiensis TaxID=1706839 RepID=A0A4U0R7A5_9RHOB|nr:feruloyl-CoA synthase [Paracoccus gahaiensis]TJZ90941.1 feruloyl-CoA synthase [Paracoccus gahaiensis]